MNAMHVLVGLAVLVLLLGSLAHVIVDQRLEGQRLLRQTEAKLKWDAEAREREAAHRAVRERVVGVARAAEAACLAKGSATSPWRKKKVIVWDGEANQPSEALARLPAVMRGDLGDAEATFVLLAKRELEQVKTYQRAVGGFGVIPGYRVEVTACVVQLPVGEATGAYVVRGDDPPEKLVRTGQGGVDARAVLGDVVGPLVEWIRAMREE